MLLVLAVLYLQDFINVGAAPISATFPHQTNPGSYLTEDCLCPQTRSRWDIVWGCLVTIFACSWVSVHPNIPGPGEGRWKKALRRLELTFWSIISPELIIYWAGKQWTAARHLASDYSSEGWTRTHGYFIQMGGFMLYDGDKAVGVLGPKDLRTLLKEKKIAMPKITQEEIEDRSKGDGLSKTVIIVQTAWFIAQCITRKIQGLMITELELVTLAFAALTLVMYSFWWHKPLDVQTTVPVYLLRPTPLEISILDKRVEGLSMETVVVTHGDNTLNETTTLHGQSLHSPDFIDQPDQVWPAINLAKLALRALWLLSGILFRWPARGLTVVVRRINDIINSDNIVQGNMHVDTFYVYDASASVQTHEMLALFFALPFVGIIFGAIHCTGWNFFFPSHIEAVIWRISSAVITIIPVLGLLGILFEKLGNYCHSDDETLLVSLSLTTFFYFIVAMLPCYVLARIALLVEALISLRDLPPEALAVDDWTSFLPHI